MNEFKDWFLQKSPREQLMLGVMTILVTLTLIYVLVLLPLINQRDKQLVNNRALIAQQMEVRRLAAEVLGQQQSGNTRQRSLAQITNTTLRNQGLKMEDFQPTGNNNVRVRLARVEFNKVMSWLDELENKEGVQVKEVSVTADDIKGLLSTVTVKLHRN